MFKDAFKDTDKDIKKKKNEIITKAVEKQKKQEWFIDFIRYEAQKKRYTVNFIKELQEMPYDVYLNTPHWGRVKKAAYGRYGHTCFNCESKRRIHVHHLNYSRRGHENMEDLMLLCEECHQLVHETIDEVKAVKQNFTSAKYD